MLKLYYTIIFGMLYWKEIYKIDINILNQNNNTSRIKSAADKYYQRKSKLNSVFSSAILCVF